MGASALLSLQGFAVFPTEIKFSNARTSVSIPDLLVSCSLVISLFQLKPKNNLLEKIHYCLTGAKQESAKTHV